MTLATAMLAVPLITMGLILLPNSIRLIGYLNTLGMLALLAAAVATIPLILTQSSIDAWHQLIRIDALSGLVVTLVAFVAFQSSLYSVGYWEGQPEHERGSLRKIKGYYALFDLFVLSMVLVCITDNLGILWVALEATTLTSAFLIGYHQRAASLEAAWRYLIVCSVGISFALVGIILAYASAVHAIGFHPQALTWSHLASVANRLDPATLKLAYVFAVVGFGTKAGLVPMHTWLPDAHSEAPTPVSALLSGVLLKCSIYAIVRFTILANHGLGEGFAQPILVGLGLLSIAVATPFILAETHIKRLLGYHSIEHIGIITLGLGFGSPLAVYGSLFHILNHAMTKSLLFFTAGNLAMKYGTVEMDKMKGALSLMLLTGGTLLIGGLALAGSPPFSIFASEFLIIMAGIGAGQRLATGLFILLLVIIFAALLHHFSEIAFSAKPAGSAEEPAAGELNPLTVWALVLPLLSIVVMGWTVPGPLSELLQKATEIVAGVRP